MEKENKNKLRDLYFVDSVFTPMEGDVSTVTLFPTEDEKEQGARVLSLNSEQLKMTNHSGTIREGWFVFYNEDNNQQHFSYGNLSQYARQQFRTFNRLQGHLLDRYLIPAEWEDATMLRRLECSDTLDVISYHVNVGHGNCSVILLCDGSFYQIWMVDCSVIDKSNWRNYSGNLETCFEAIKQRLGKSKNEPLIINRFFLTHTHYDHYNGLEYLVDKHYIDNNTVCYINLYYHCASKCYTRVLDKLLNAGVRFIEPVSKNSIGAIRFLHPECRIFRSKATVVGAPSEYRIVNSPLNDSSTVILIALGKMSMAFPGDLEYKGFDNMSKSRRCSPFLCYSDYYVVSHHGSINGHPNRPCMNEHLHRPCMNEHLPLPTILRCVESYLKKSILMGRDGAYRGIYNPQVVNYYSKLPCGMIYTEKAPHYVELEWGSGKELYK